MRKCILSLVLVLVASVPGMEASFYKNNKRLVWSAAGFGALGAVTTGVIGYKHFSNKESSKIAREVAWNLLTFHPVVATQKFIELCKKDIVLAGAVFLELIVIGYFAGEGVYQAGKGTVSWWKNRERDITKRAKEIGGFGQLKTDAYDRVTTCRHDFGGGAGLEKAVRFYKDGELVKTIKQGAYEFYGAVKVVDSKGFNVHRKNENWIKVEDSHAVARKEKIAKEGQQIVKSQAYSKLVRERGQFEEAAKQMQGENDRLLQEKGVLAKKIEEMGNEHKAAMEQVKGENKRLNQTVRQLKEEAKNQPKGLGKGFDDAAKNFLNAFKALGKKNGSAKEEFAKGNIAQVFVRLFSMLGQADPKVKKLVDGKAKEFNGFWSKHAGDKTKQFKIEE